MDSLHELENTILNKPALLAYFYNDACAPCQALRPKVSEMAAEQFPKMELVFINAANNPEITAHFGIFSAPTLLVFFEGKETIRESKYISIPELQSKTERYYRMVFEEE